MAFEDLSLEMARRLKELRESKGWSLVELKKRLKEECGISISKDSLINYETAEKYHQKAYSNNGMKVEYLRGLADLYGVSTDYLLGIADDPVPDPTIRSVCSYTGLSGSTVKTLHSYEHGSLEHSFCARYFDDLLCDCGTISVITDCIKAYVFAQKTATMQRLSLANRDKRGANLPRYEDGKYSIPASDAADLYYCHAISEAQGSIESIIRQMAEEMLRPYHWESPKLDKIDSFRWGGYDEEDKE